MADDFERLPHALRLAASQGIDTPGFAMAALRRIEEAGGGERMPDRLAIKARCGKATPSRYNCTEFAGHEGRCFGADWPGTP